MLWEKLSAKLNVNIADPSKWDLIQMMRINRSLGETDLIYRWENSKLKIWVNNSENLKKLNMQKAQSFKQEWTKQDLSTGLWIKWKPK